jgi:hypothetical protein
VQNGQALQEEWISSALANGSMTLSSTTDEEWARLNLPKGSGQDNGQPWTGRCLLVLVNASRGSDRGNFFGICHLYRRRCH